MNGLVLKLSTAPGFVEAATHVCETARELGVREVVITLNFDGGPVALAVDNATDMTDEHRLFAISQRNWETNPLYIAMRERLGTVGTDKMQRAQFFRTAREHGYTGRAKYLWAFPLVEPCGWFGLVACGTIEPISPPLERDLAMLATQLSVWCTSRGIGAVPRTPAPLGPRQYGVAKLASRGLQNAEIARELAISTNTVKARLKEIFERFEVHTRNELTQRIRRFAPLDSIKPGITHLDAVSITRAP